MACGDYRRLFVLGVLLNGVSCRGADSDSGNGVAVDAEVALPTAQPRSAPASVRLSVDQFAPQGWQPPESLNTFVLKSLNDEVVKGIAFTDADRLPNLRSGLLGPVIDEDFTAEHEFLAVFGMPHTTIGKEEPQQLLETLIAAKGFGGLYSGAFGASGFRVHEWVEGESLSGEFRVPFQRVLDLDANYPPRDWSLTLANEGGISLDFEGPYREWAGQPDTCFSPTQNIDSATSALGFGCACDPVIDVEAPCLTSYYEGDPTGGGQVFFMYCDPEMSQWQWGHDGPCGL
jgi:hypothetical protein